MKAIVSVIITLLGASTISARATDAKALWLANCTPCHGALGKSDTKMGQILGAMDLTNASKQSSFSDAQAADAIKNGIKQDGNDSFP